MKRREKKVGWSSRENVDGNEAKTPHGNEKSKRRMQEEKNLTNHPNEFACRL
jgi:hypothetical protein